MSISQVWLNRGMKKVFVISAILFVFASISIPCICGVQYTAEVATPPLVTNPSANPPSIAADGVQKSQLDVTVTDASGIYSVTVNLSALGGLSAKEMVKIGDTNVYTTNTTAAVETSPGTYDLWVNATDNSPNRNSNTSVSIRLTVTALQVITYDFSTGTGSDKWAYRYQHDAKPPTTNNVPRIKFPPPQYDKIKTEDGTMRVDASSRRGYYAIHRFKFDIAEQEENMTGISVLWTGRGFRRFGTHGATLYIWNFSAGKYEQLDRKNDTCITLEGTITNNIGNYVDSDGTLIIIAEQNTPQWRFWRWPFRSRLDTDYVKVDITPIK